MPDINFDCPECGQNIDAPGDMAGQEVECPTCGKSITIPGTPTGIQEPEAAEDTPKKKSSTMRLEVPDDLKAPPPQRRVIKIKRLNK